MTDPLTSTARTQSRSSAGGHATQVQFSTESACSSGSKMDKLTCFAPRALEVLYGCISQGEGIENMIIGETPDGSMVPIVMCFEDYEDMEAEIDLIRAEIVRHAQQSTNGNSGFAIVADNEADPLLRETASELPDGSSIDPTQDDDDVISQHAFQEYSRRRDDLFIRLARHVSVAFNFRRYLFACESVVSSDDDEEPCEIMVIRTIGETANLRHDALILRDDAGHITELCEEPHLDTIDYDINPEIFALVGPDDVSSEERIAQFRSLQKEGIYAIEGSIH